MKKVFLFVLVATLVMPVFVVVAATPGLEINQVYWTNKSPFVLEGKAEAGSTIEIHGKGISFTVGDQGKFSVELNVEEGFNLFAITAAKNGMSSTKGFMVEMDTKPPEASILVNNQYVSEKSVTIELMKALMMTVEGITEPGCTIIADGVETITDSMKFTAKFELPPKPSITECLLQIRDKAGNVTEFVITAVNRYEKEAIMMIGSTKALVDGVEMTMNAPLIVLKGRTYLPVKFLIEKILGGTYSYDEATKTATLTKGEKIVTLSLGSDKAVVDGKEINAGGEPQLYEGQFMAPFRFVCEAFDCRLHYNAAAKTMTIFYPENP